MTFLNGKCSAGFLGQLQVRWYWIAMYSARGFRKKLGSRNVNLKRSWDPFTSQWIGLTWLVEIWQECQTRDGPIGFDNHEEGQALPKRRSSFLQKLQNHICQQSYSFSDAMVSPAESRIWQKQQQWRSHRYETGSRGKRQKINSKADLSGIGLGFMWPRIRILVTQD